MWEQISKPQIMWMTHLLLLGKTDFGSDEDAHVIGDCIKVLLFTI